MAQQPDAKRDDIVTGEIIPPDRADAQPAHSRSGIWISVKTPGSGHFATATPGPFVIILVLLAFAILLAVLFLFLIGALLIWIPVAALLLAVLLLYGFIRGHFRRLR